MKLGNIILSEAIQAQNDEQYNFSYLRALALNVFYIYFEGVSVGKGQETRKGPMMGRGVVKGL